MEKGYAFRGFRKYIEICRYFFPSLRYFNFSKGAIHKGRPQLGGEGGSAKSGLVRTGGGGGGGGGGAGGVRDLGHLRTRGEGGSKSGQILRTSFMYGPKDVF